MGPCRAALKSSYYSQAFLGVSGWTGILVWDRAKQSGVGMRLRTSNTLILHPAAPKPGAFLTGLNELCGRCPHWSLLQLLTEVGASNGVSQGGGCTGCLP